MRVFAFLPFILLAACSEANGPAKQAEAPAAEAIKAGQWEMAAEVVAVTQRDKGSPAMKMEKGSKTTSSSCVAEADTKKPQPALFAPEGLKCDYRDDYIRGGKINATLGCTGAGLNGDVSALINGSYTAETIEATAITETRLHGDGDVKVETKLTGRRTGDCVPAPAKS
jgi:hypothetical protein